MNESRAPRPDTEGISHISSEEAIRRSPQTSLLWLPPSSNDVLAAFLVFALDARGQVNHTLCISPEVARNSEYLDEAVNNACSDTEGCVKKEFSYDAINALNSFCFKNLKFPLPPTFTAYPPYERALTEFVQRECKGKEAPYRIINFGSGENGANPFLDLKNLPNREPVVVTLSDIVEPGIPHGDTGNVTFETRHDDVLRDFRRMKGKGRFDLAVANNVFDSVWTDHDRSYQKADGRWYRMANRLRVSPLVRDKNRLLAALRSGENKGRLTMDDLTESIIIEEIAERVPDISKVPFGPVMERYFSGEDQVRTNFPGGVVAKVQEAFRKILKPDGVFLIGDTAVPDKETMREFFKYLRTHNGVSPLPVQFRVSDFGLAKEVLETLGYTVSVKDLREEFCQLTPEERREYEMMLRRKMVQRKGCFVMEVRKSERAENR